MGFVTRKSVTFWSISSQKGWVWLEAYKSTLRRRRRWKFEFEWNGIDFENIIWDPSVNMPLSLGRAKHHKQKDFKKTLQTFYSIHLSLKTCKINRTIPIYDPMMFLLLLLIKRQIGSCYIMTFQPNLWTELPLYFLPANL